MTPCWKRFAPVSCPSCNSAGPCEAGWSTTPAFQKRYPLGRCRPAVLWPARQTGQLPGRRHAVSCDRSCQPANRAPPLSATGLGGRHCTAGVRRCSGRGRIPNQASDRTRPDPRSAASRRAACRRACRRRIRYRHSVPRRHYRTWSALCRRHPVFNQSMAAGNGAIATEALWRTRTTAVPGRARCRARPCLCQATRQPTTETSLAACHLARRYQYHPGLTLCRRASAAGTP